MHPQVFNQLNSRKIKDEYNVFDGLMRSRSFIYISLVEVVLQVRGKQCGRSTSRPLVQQPTVARYHQSIANLLLPCK